MRNNRNRINRFLLIALLVSLCFNYYQWSDIKSSRLIHAVEVDSLVTARTDVEKTLTDIYSELNQYKGINTRLDSLLVEANDKLDEQRNRIENLITKEKNSDGFNQKLQLEIEKLEKLRDNYLDKVDKLLVENESLKKDKSSLTSAVDSLNRNLETTVSAASVLKSEYFKATAFKKKNKKYAATVMARHTNKLEACFTLLENQITKAGQKTVYLRIIEPGGKVLGNRSSGSNTFQKPGSTEDLLFTTSKDIDYNNSKMDLCIDWEDTAIFSSGTYLLEIYVDGSLSGAGSITLR